MQHRLARVGPSALRNAMAPVAGKKRDEGNAIVAHAAILTAKDHVHRDRIRTCLRYKRNRVTVRTVQPNRMGLMGKADIRHLLGVSHRDIKVKHVHCVRGRKSGPWSNGSRPQSSHPVGEADDIALHLPCCVIDSLQPRKIGIGFIVNRIAFKGSACRVQLGPRRGGSLSRSVFDGRHIGRRFQKRQKHRFTCKGNAQRRTGQHQQCNRTQADATEPRAANVQRIRH
jgi:hypothetical protein